MVKVLTALIEGDIALIPFDKPTDYDYLVSLAQGYKWNKLNREQMYELIKNYGRYFWKSYYKDQLYGVGYICFNVDLNVWTIDLYRDDRLCKAIARKADLTYRPGVMLIKHIFETTDIDRLYGITDSQNRALLKVGKRLGFKFCREIKTMFGNFTMIVKDRED